MTYWGKHDLARVFRCHLSLELFFGGHICENENYLALRTKVVRLRTDVVKHTIEFLIFRLLFPFLSLFAFRTFFFVYSARRRKTLMHV